MKKKITHEEYDNIKKMFDDKISISEIACKYSVSRPTIYSILRNEYGMILVRGIAKHRDKIGKIFGYLLIKDFVQRGDRFHWSWRAICECKNCGNKHFETSIQNILRGSVTSCGCRRDQYKNITGKYSKQFTGYEEIRGKTWSRIKLRALESGREFLLDIKDAWNLYEKQNRKCALTGLPIVFGKHNGETTSSLDRIDSLKGYSIDNVQWVHKDVNVMKSIFPLKYFISICDLVYKNSPKIKFDLELKEEIKYGRNYLRGGQRSKTRNLGR